MKSDRKAKDKLHKACERASETRGRTLHGQEQNRMRMRELRDSDLFQVNTQVQSHALLHQRFGTSVPFISCMNLELDKISAYTPVYSIMYTHVQSLFDNHHDWVVGYKNCQCTCKCTEFTSTDLNM